MTSFISLSTYKGTVLMESSLYLVRGVEMRLGSLGSAPNQKGRDGAGGLHIWP